MLRSIFAVALLGLSLPAAADSFDSLTIDADYAGPSGDHSDWVDTGITVLAGDTVIISATGLAGAIPSVDEGPDGGVSTAANSTFLAPGLTIGSLVGAIGNGAAFQAGSSLTMQASTSGTLYLGYNDSLCTDNHGSFDVDVEVIEPRVVLYADAGFGGASQELTVGYHAGPLAIGNDVVSSVEVPEGFTVTLYQHSPGNGDVLVLTADASSLGSLDNETSNVLVERD